MYLMEVHCNTRACAFLYFHHQALLFLGFVEVVTIIHTWKMKHLARTDLCVIYETRNSLAAEVEQLMTLLLSLYYFLNIKQM